MSKLKTFLRKKEIIFLLAIALLGLFLRLYKLKENFYYTMDEEVMNLIQRRIVLGEHFPLIGSVSAISTYLGPLFYYFGAGLLFLSKLNPLGQGIFASLLGAVNIYLIYRICKEFFNKTTGLIAATLYASSFLMVLFDRRYWHLTPGPFLSLIILWSIYKIKKGSIKFIYPLTLALIFGWNTDYTNLILFLFTAICWVVFKLPVKKKEVFVALFIFLISNIPLLVFDLRHDFLNVKAILSYSLQKSEAEKKIQPGDREPLVVTGEDRIQMVFLPFITFSRLIYASSDLNISEQHTYCKPYILKRNRGQGVILPILAFLIVVVFIFLAFRQKNTNPSLGYKLIVTFYLIFQSGLLGYTILLKGDFFEHYLATLFPYFFIMLAVVLNSLYSSKFRIIAIFLTTLFVALNVNLVMNAYNPFGFNLKMDAARFALNKVRNENFSLDSLSSCYRWDGFYYPFIFLGKHPVKSYQDPNYAWLYDYEVSEKHPNKVVVMVPKGKFEDNKFEDIYKRYQQWVIAKEKFGGLEVLILDNSKGNFR